MQIDAKGLCLGYGGKTIVSGLDFTVSRGDFIAVVGENGSGKTTLIKTLAGLIPKTGGSLAVSRGIGYLPQGDELMRDFPASCEEIVYSGLSAHPFISKSEKARAKALMEKLNILPLAKKSFGTLSGGQQRRVLLARAYLCAKELLLLDEPATALDPAATQEMYEILADINQKDGITVIMISHDIPSALLLASHVLHVGDTLFFGSTGEYVESGLAGGDGK